MEPLLDKEFLKQLFNKRQRETYVRLISLDIDENPREQIEGRTTQGSVSLDGASALRRTCNLSLVTDKDTEINDYYWTLTSKFKLLIGLKNTVDKKYPDIIWFKMGTYVITSCSIAYSTSGYTISITGKDKMCLINGDVSGAIYASVDFGMREEVDTTTGTKTIVDIEIPDIIMEAVHEYAQEPWHNIIIKDIPKYGLNLLEYTGEDPMYVLKRAIGDDESQQIIINQDYPVILASNDQETVISDSENIHYLSINALTDSIGPGYTQIKLTNLLDAPTYYVIRVMSGQTAGFGATKLTFPRNGNESGLITSIGESVTSVLDKIVNFLGDYEYFYNEDGQFIFQKKNKYLDTNWYNNDFTTTGNGNEYELISFLPTSWIFDGNELITYFNNSPNLNNIKNDFAIWGTRTNAAGTEIPVHFRYAIDQKPKIYTSIHASADEIKAWCELNPELSDMYTKFANGKPSIVYYTSEFEGQIPIGVEAHLVDWRELIYQMAIDYMLFNHWDTFQIKIMEANGRELYPGGKTGYEQYYVDIEGNWRYLYNPFGEDITSGMSIKTLEEIDPNKDIYVRNYYVGSANARGNLCLDGTDNYYFTPDDTPLCLTLDGHYGAIINPPSGYYKNYYLIDNGSADSHIYKVDLNQTITSSYTTYPLYGYTTYKYNLLVSYKQESFSNLPTQLSGGLGSDDSINAYTVYDCGADGYYFYVYSSFTNAASDSKRVRVKLSFEGLKDYNTDEFVFQRIPNVANSHGSAHGGLQLKVTCIKSMPSNFDLYAGPLDVEHNSTPGLVTTQFIGDRVNPHALDSVVTRAGVSAYETQVPNNQYVKLSSVITSYNRHIYYDENGDLRRYYTFLKRTIHGDPYYEDIDGNPTLNPATGKLYFEHKPIAYYQQEYYYNSEQDFGETGWNNLKDESPELLNFWFDFLDAETSEIGKYGVKQIQSRTFAEQDSDAHAIYYRDTLNIVYNLSDTPQNLLYYIRPAYNIFQLPKAMEQYFHISSSGKSCKDVLDKYLYQKTYANENISLSTIPIYNLQPNDRISIQNENTKINGEYVINSISIPLTYDGTMSVNAVKAIDKIY